MSKDIGQKATEMISALNIAVKNQDSPGRDKGLDKSCGLWPEALHRPRRLLGLWGVDTNESNGDWIVPQRHNDGVAIDDFKYPS
jgi:hypothetical protein